MTPKPEDLPDVILTVIPIPTEPGRRGISLRANGGDEGKDDPRTGGTSQHCELPATPARDPFPVHSICYVRTGTPAPEPWRLHQWGIFTFPHPLSAQVA